MKSKITKKQRGLTLIEVIISLALIGIISIALLAGIQFSFKTLFASGDFMQASYVRQEKMENFIRTGAYGANTSTITSTVTPDEIVQINWTTTALPNFSITGDHLLVDYNENYFDDSVDVFRTKSITIDYP